METCNRCHQIIMPQDHAVRSRTTGGPGLHVRRFMCACGCKRVQFYTVMNVFKLRSSFPKPDQEPTIPLYDFPIFRDSNYVNA